MIDLDGTLAEDVDALLEASRSRWTWRGSRAGRLRFGRPSQEETGGYPANVTFQRVAPVFPVRDIDMAVEHYRKLGFTVRHYDGPDLYAFADRDGIELHIVQVDDLRPERNMSAVYVYVDDADALYREWSRAELDGRLVAPTDTSYGLREGACLDRDANLIRFGSEIAKRPRK